MAGITGICGKALLSDQKTVRDSVQSTVYSANTSVEELHQDTHLILQKSFMPFVELEKMKAHQDGVSVWIDGEIYNQREVSVSPGNSFADTLLHHYSNATLESLLQKVDGIYVAVIYDLKKQQLHIVTDRYGLKVSYLSAQHNCLIFAPELKCFPYFREFNLEIRKDVVDCFIQLEHMMSTATWFEKVEVTEPCTIYSYSWSLNSFTRKKYWSWSSIKPSSVSLEEASEEIGLLLENAVKARKFGNARIGVGLSGGFDSRAILAAIHQDKPITYTFGIEESADVQNAKQVAKVAGVQNIHFDMRVDHWLERRFSGIWKTDGMLNMYHMHYSHLMEQISAIMDINLSGFLGDGVLGQTYLFKKGKLFLNKRIDADTARHYYGDHARFSDPSDPFFDIKKTDAYLIYNRGRRLTGLGMEEANKTIFQRLPFMDNKLMDFSYSLPDEYRKGNKAYHGALIKKYPAFYKNIPHATSGVPISINPSLFYKSRKLYYRWLWVFKFKMGIATSFSDVYNWIKEPETVTFIRQVLNPKNALYSNFTDVNFLERYFEPHLSGKGNFVKPTMGALTFEIWLQQILNKKFLNR